MGRRGELVWFRFLLECEHKDRPFIGFGHWLDFGFCSRQHLLPLTCTYAHVKLHKHKFQLFKKILFILENIKRVFQRDLHELITEQLYDINDLSDELNNLVRMNTLSFNPTTSCYALQGHSLYYALQLYVQNVLKSGV